MDYIPLIDTKKLGQTTRKKCSCLWGLSWFLFATACTIALAYGLHLRGII